MSKPADSWPGPRLENIYRGSVWAAMVLDGTKAQDLPDVDVGHREFVINLKTAKKLNILSAQLGRLLLMADEVIT
jgi:hypothetical protein